MGREYSFGELVTANFLHGLYSPNAPTYTGTQAAYFLFDENGNLKVKLASSIEVDVSSFQTINGTTADAFVFEDGADLSTITPHYQAFGGKDYDTDLFEPIYVDSDGSIKAQLQIVNTAVSANTGTTDAGTQRVTVATDDNVSTKLTSIDSSNTDIKTSTGTMAGWDNAASDGASVSGDVADGVADAGEPVGIGGLALSGQRTAVTIGDRVKAVFNLFGELVIAGYSWASNCIRTSEIDPLDEHYLDIALVNTINISATTHYYPGILGATIAPQKDLCADGEFIDADGSLTGYMEMTNAADPATATWKKVYGYDDKNNSVVNQVTVTNGTLEFALSWNNVGYKRWRWVVVATGATNTVVTDARKKAL